MLATHETAPYLAIPLGRASCNRIDMTPMHELDNLRYRISRALVLMGIAMVVGGLVGLFIFLSNLAESLK